MSLPEELIEVFKAEKASFLLPSSSFPTMFDMHCHFGFAKYPHKLAKLYTEAGVGAFSNTVTPDEYLTLRNEFKDFPYIYAGLGFHPWWVDRWVKSLRNGEEVGASSEVEALNCEGFRQFATLASEVSLIGEIGLDFSQKYKASKACQIAVFRACIDACMNTEEPESLERKIISLHAVKSTTAVLEILEQSACVKKHICIFHRFQGSKEELMRALRDGCYFSVSSQMKGKPIFQAMKELVPPEKLLIETDLPRYRN